MLAQCRLMGEPETASMDEEGVLHLTLMMMMMMMMMMMFLLILMKIK
jgi:hypothetical protein